MSVRRILVVDDEPSLADTLAEIFTLAGYEAFAVYNAADALDFIAARPPELVISDVMMPGMDGVSLAKRIRAEAPDCRVLLFSGNADTQRLLEDAEREGYSFEILAKPVPPPQMLARIAAMLAEPAQ